MFYLIQDNIFRERNYDKIFDAMDRLSLEYEFVTVKPFIDDVEIDTKRKDVFVFGGTKLARIIKPYNYYPGSLLNDNHDYLVYSEYYKDNLLNYDSKIVSLKDSIEWNNKIYFIRPCADDKLFTGQVFNKESWLQMKSNLLNNGKNPDSLLQIATPKNIQSEFRLYIVDGKVITGSQYTMNGRYYTNPIVDDDIIHFAEDMCKVFQLADCFVMDIARTTNGLKIVECGCINCAGFYDSDLIKLVIAIEDYYSSK